MCKIFRFILTNAFLVGNPPVYFMSGDSKSGMCFKYKFLSVSHRVLRVEDVS